MKDWAAEAMDWPGGIIPEFLRPVANFAVGVVSRDGALIDANFGFVNLLPASMPASDMRDLRSLFSQPRFEDLAMRCGERPGAPIYEGILHFGGVCSLNGAVYDWTDTLLIAGEHEVAGLQLLRARLADVGEALIEARRQLEAALGEADRQKALAEAALAQLDASRQRSRQGGARSSDPGRAMAKPVLVRSRIE